MEILGEVGVFRVFCVRKAGKYVDMRKESWKFRNEKWFYVIRCLGGGRDLVGNF